jgi:tetratricopeptide (TPR) repeat protein
MMSQRFLIQNRAHTPGNLAGQWIQGMARQRVEGLSLPAQHRSSSAGDAQLSLQRLVNGALADYGKAEQSAFAAVAAATPHFDRHIETMEAPAEHAASDEDFQQAIQRRDFMARVITELGIDADIFHIASPERLLRVAALCMPVRGLPDDISVVAEYLESLRDLLEHDFPLGLSLRNSQSMFLPPDDDATYGKYGPLTAVQAHTARSPQGSPIESMGGLFSRFDTDNVTRKEWGLCLETALLAVSPAIALSVYSPHITPYWIKFHINPALLKKLAPDSDSAHAFVNLLLSHPQNSDDVSPMFPLDPLGNMSLTLSQHPSATYYMSPLLFGAISAYFYNKDTISHADNVDFDALDKDEFSTEHTQAVAELEMSILLGTDIETAELKIGFHAVGAGQFEKALHFLQKFYPDVSMNPYYLFYLAYANERMGNTDEAIRIYKESLALLRPKSEAEIIENISKRIRDLQPS